MKLYILFKCKNPCISLKVIRVVKLTFILMLTFLLQVNAAGYAQRINLSVRNAPLGKTLKEIKKQIGYTFFYNTQMLYSAKPVTINVNNATLEEVLTLCFKDQPLNYTITENAVIVMKKTEKPQKDLVESEIQNITITGKVTSTTGEPMIGVSVKLKGIITSGSSTDLNGNYSISVPNEGATLVFS